MPTLTINGKEVTVEPGSTVMQACEAVGEEIPRFCYHERLSIAGNCRMCLVEMEKSPKPIASCAMPAGDEMVIHTNTEEVKRAREGVMEFLLINHPLDCPICDQGGECDLQDQATAYGRGLSRYQENKRAVREKYMGPLIKTVMTRCIHCTRCVRFADEIAGVPSLGSVGRGEGTEIITYLEQSLQSELSGNIIDLCPVGALTSKPYAFTARSWELNKTESVDVMDAVGSAIRIDARGNEVMRVLPRLNEDVNEEWISDKTRFACDGLKVRRLDRPWVRRDGKLVEASWQEAFESIAAVLNDLPGDSIAGIVGDLADMESMVVLKDMLENLGSERIECRQDGAHLDAGCRAGYIFNTTIAGIEEADYCLLVGTNPRHEAAIINARLRKATLAGLKVGRVGPVDDLTYRVEDFGDDAAILQKILDGIHPAADALEAAEKPMLILGQGALTRADGDAVLGLTRAIADKYGLIGADWNGFNILHTAAARVGALDLGLTTEGGVDGILAAAAKGKTRAVFLLGADEVDMAKLKKPFVVYIGSHGDAGVSEADVILPAAAYTEKQGTYINTEGRAQMAQRAIFPPGDAREDWTIFRALSDVLGVTLPYDDIKAVRARLVELLPDLGETDQVQKAEWAAFGGDPKGVKKGAFSVAVEDFYLTNAVARASNTMAQCSAVARGEDIEGTGTDG